MDTKTDLWTPKELAGLLRVSPATVRSWQREGKIPARRLSPKVIRYDLREVLAALAAVDREGGDG